jgi:hypothetical protein
MVAIVVHVAIRLLMVVMVAPSDPAQWVLVEKVGVPLVTDQRGLLLPLVVVGDLLDRHEK